MLLRKTEGQFISRTFFTKILKLDIEKTAEAISWLENQGFIERAEMEGYWQRSLRGKLLCNKKFDKVYRVETLRTQLQKFMERAEAVNSSKEFPDCILYIKITSEYPIEQRSSGIYISYALDRKQISEETYDLLAHNLRKQYTGNFGNIIESLYYPHEAIRAFLQSHSHVLKLRQHDKNKIHEMAGYKLLGEE